MSKTNLILLGMIAGAALRPVSAAPPTYRISADQVAATVSKTGVRVASRQVTMLSDVVASTSTPSLAVRSIEPRGDHRALLRLECERPDQCLPFYVSIRVDETAEGLQTQPSPAILTPPSHPSSTQFVIRTGSTVTLQLDSQRVHISIPVISLENGAVGQTIHVRSKDHRLVYAAQVIDGTLLKGRL